MYFPNRLELSFLLVLALPKAKADRGRGREGGREDMKYYFIQYIAGMITSQTFQDRVGLQYLLLDPGVLATDCRQELQYELGGLCLPSSTLSAVGGVT